MGLTVCLALMPNHSMRRHDVGWELLHRGCNARFSLCVIAVLHMV
jgi:hypothetical protein